MTTTPAISFSHMGFFVSDIARMEDFYRRIMGFTVTDRGDLDTPHGPVSLVFLSRDPTEHHQVVLATGKPADMRCSAANSLQIFVFRCGALVEACL